LRAAKPLATSSRTTPRRALSKISLGLPLWARSSPATTTAVQFAKDVLAWARVVKASKQVHSAARTDSPRRRGDAERALLVPLLQKRCVIPAKKGTKVHRSFRAIAGMGSASPRLRVQIESLGFMCDVSVAHRGSFPSGRRKSWSDRQYRFQPASVRRARRARRDSDAQSCRNMARVEDRETLR